MEIDTLMQIVATRQRARDGTARAIRQRAGVTLAEMARTVGVTESTMSRWESGQRNPRGEAALRWMEALAELERATTGAAA